MSTLPPLEEGVLPPGIRARIIPGINGLSMHLLEAGTPGQPCLLLLHGFPELAWSWRRIMPALAAAGYHVVAPDQRGYGRTTGCDTRYEADLAPFRMLNLVRDQLGLVAALGYGHVEAVIGHDFGSPVAAWCALIRPDIFRRVALMSAPFAGPPALPEETPRRGPAPDIHAALAALPRPRRHYQWYYSEPGADAEMWHCPEGVHAFLRAYYHMKSADWPGNRPFPLAGWTAEALAQMPTYYIMDLGRGMAETVRPERPDAATIADCRWLPESDLAVYAGEYGRTGFQGGLNWYRCRTTGRFEAEVFAGRTIDIPSIFIAGASDWGIEQVPGALRRMREIACTRMSGVHLIEGAGHWVQQEQPRQVAELLLRWLG
jgi:pimeloyl-ACP methyl ester carboxylesterase